MEDDEQPSKIKKSTTMGLSASKSERQWQIVQRRALTPLAFPGVEIVDLSFDLDGLAGCLLRAKLKHFIIDIEIEDLETTEEIIENKYYSITVFPNLDIATEMFTEEQLDQDITEISYCGAVETIAEAEEIIRIFEKQEAEFEKSQENPLWPTSYNYLPDALRLLFKYYSPFNAIYDEKKYSTEEGMRIRPAESIEPMLEKAKTRDVYSSQEP
jgi:hypothetical protein